MITGDKEAAANLRGKPRLAVMNLRGRQWVEGKALRGLRAVDFREFLLQLFVERHQQRAVAAITGMMATGLFDLRREARVKTAAGDAQVRESPGLNHLAQRREHARGSGTGFRAGFGAVEDGDLHPGLRQPPGDRATDDPATDNQHVGALGEESPIMKPFASGKRYPLNSFYQPLSFRPVFANRSEGSRGFSGSATFDRRMF